MKTQLKVGLFTFLGLLLIGGVTIFVNDRPFWWRKCQPIYVNVDDATGLKNKSPVRSLGLEIGYLRSVELSETYVRLGVCITAPIQVLPSTRAYIRSEGFLGDKFLELKPVRYTGVSSEVKSPRKVLPVVVPAPATPASPAPAAPARSHPSKKTSGLQRFLREISGMAVAYAADPVIQDSPHESAQISAQGSESKDIPVGSKGEDVQAVVDRVNGLVKEMTSLTTNLKDAINPDELRQTMRQLNKTLENASKTLSPEGGLNTTAQRTLSKLEDAIEQLRDIIARINRGEGSVGKVVNDPVYADEFRKAIENVNRLLNRVSQIRLQVDVAALYIPAFDGTRANANLKIWPAKDRYYLIGVSVDPRGRRIKTMTETTVTAGGVTTKTYSESIVLDPTAYVPNVMLGKVFLGRIEVAAGALYGDGAASVVGWLGPSENEEMFKLRTDMYFRGQGAGFNLRITGQAHPLYAVKGFSSLYLSAGMESVIRPTVLFGTGVSFDDEDIRTLFVFLN